LQRVVVLVLVTAIAIRAGIAGADATPVGQLPKHPTTTILATRGSLVALALPRQRSASGLVWRLARPADPRILRQVSEADLGPSVVIVFRAIGRGSTRVSFALTRGDTGPSALRATTYSIRVK
jgi:hypothetical protein